MDYRAMESQTTQLTTTWAVTFLPYLEQAMRNRNINYEVLLGDSHRELVDLNRKESMAVNITLTLRVARYSNISFRCAFISL